MRIPLLLRLAFAEALPRERLRTLVADQRAVHAERLARYRDLEQAARIIGGSDRDLVTLRFGVHYEEAALRWFDEDVAAVLNSPWTRLSLLGPEAILRGLRVVQVDPALEPRGSAPFLMGTVPELLSFDVAATIVHLVQSQAADLATRQAYDAVAADYAQMLPDMTLEAPLDRAVLSAFVEMLNGQPDAVVAEVGCGSGRVTAHLADAGLPVIGLDLSPAMAAVASSLRPDISFAAAHMGALPLRPGVLAGIVAWYSVINLPGDALPQVLREFARVMLPDAPVLLAFQCGEGERVDRTSAYGHPVPMTYYRHALDEVAAALVTAGFRLHSTLRREPALGHETTSQGFLMAHRQRTA